jgi:hypothetical protein
LTIASTEGQARMSAVSGSLTDLGGWNVGAEDFLAAVLQTVAQPVWVVDPECLTRFAKLRASAPPRPPRRPGKQPPQELQLVVRIWSILCDRTGCEQPPAGHGVAPYTGFPLNCRNWTQGPNWTP